MVLVDFSQVFMGAMHASSLANVSALAGSNPGLIGPNPKLARSIMWSMLRNYRRMFILDKTYGSMYSDLVLCCDNGTSWRKEIFPEYKASRLEARGGEKISQVAEYTMFKQELAEFGPFLLLDIQRAEADDIIATLATECMTIPKMVVSSDKDFFQLQQYPFVGQYSLTKKKQVIMQNPERYLRELIITGDKGDGIPNVLSEDDCFTAKKRQKAINKRQLTTWLDAEYNEQIEPWTLPYWKRNERLIDFTHIPGDVRHAIMHEYTRQHTALENGPRPGKRLLGYFMAHRLQTMIPNIGDFV